MKADRPSPTAIAIGPTTFRMRKLDGKYVNAITTTNVSGVATYQLRLQSRDPLGSYAVTATATSNGAMVAGTTTFSVY